MNGLDAVAEGDWRAVLGAIRDALSAPLMTISGTPISPTTLLVFFLILLLTAWAARMVRNGVRRTMAMRGVTDPGTLAIATRFTYYGVVIIGLGIALQTIGLNLTALFAAGAVFAIAIGFAMQNIAENFVSGVILLAERSIKPGDILEVEGTVVQVERMGIRSTVARSRDEQELIIPNATLVSSTVTNFTLRDSIIRIKAAVGVIYGSDMALVRRTLEDTANALPWRQSEPSPRVLMTAFGDSSVDFEVSVWVDDPWRARQFVSDLNEAIWWALKERGIVIAFPQLDVHFDAPVVRALSGRADRGGNGGGGTPEPGPEPNPEPRPS